MITTVIVALFFKNVFFYKKFFLKFSPELWMLSLLWWKFYYKEPYHTNFSEIFSGAVIIGPTAWVI